MTKNRQPKGARRRPVRVGTQKPTGSGKASANSSGRNRKITAAAVAAIAALISALFAAVSYVWPSTPPSPSQPTPQLATLDPKAAAALCNANPGSLKIEQTRLRDVTGSWSVAFPASRSADARKFVSGVDHTLTLPSDQYDKFLNEELDAGAYLYGGMKLHLDITGLDSRDVVIRDIRPEVKSRTSIPVDAAIIIPTQGGEATTEAYFVLDDASPAARVRNFGGPPEDALLFDQKRFALQQGQTETFVLWFDARYAAFTFDIAVDYEVGGAKCSRTITRNGQPYQATASACPAAFKGDANHQRDLGALKKLRYGVMRAVQADEQTLKYVFKPEDPESYASSCEM